MLFSTHSSWKKQKKKRNERSHQISINIIRLRQEKWLKANMYLLLIAKYETLDFCSCFHMASHLQCIRRLLFTVIGHTKWWYNTLFARAAVLFFSARLCRMFCKKSCNKSQKTDVLPVCRRWLMTTLRLDITAANEISRKFSKYSEQVAGSF